MHAVVRRARENVTGIVSTLVIGVWMAGLFLGAEWWLPALLVGYVAVVPLTAMLAGEDEEEPAQPETGDDETDEDPIETAKRRYARGEIDEAEFEAIVERVLGTDHDGRVRLEEGAAEFESEHA
ncbi:MAG: SHOCT domain-containing protein [Halococcoides sp.]